jgi:phage/plasmid-like protein (TIGR03299 family)
MSKSTSAARSSVVSKRSRPAVITPTKIIKNGKATPPPASTAKPVDPNDCTLQHTGLAVTNGKVALAVAGGGKTTWHGFGEEILPTDTMEQVAKKAGIAWTAGSSPVQYVDQNGTLLTMHGSRVNYRLDTGAALGVVSDQYKIVQPIEILEFFRDFATKNKLMIETAGALRGGKTIWAMVKLGKDFAFMLPGSDAIDSYLRLQTGFDGGRATDAVATTTRQVCKNTENMINGDADRSGYRTPHTSLFDAKALQGALGMLGAQHKVTAKFWNELTKRKVTDKERDQFFCDLFSIDIKERDGVDSEGKPLVSGRTRNMLSQLTAAFNNGPGSTLKSANGTAYGLLQAVTYWTDHESIANDVHKDGKESARLNSAWFGLGSRTKADAQYLAAKLAGCEELVAA